MSLPVNDEIGEALARAAEILQERWGQDSLLRQNGNMCLMGAISQELGEQVCVGQSWPSVTSSNAERWDTVLKLLDFDDMRHAAFWNDHPLRERAQVVRRVRRAAKKRRRCVARARKRVANVEAGRPAWWP